MGIEHAAVVQKLWPTDVGQSMLSLSDWKKCYVRHYLHLNIGSDMILGGTTSRPNAYVSCYEVFFEV